MFQMVAFVLLINLNITQVNYWVYHLLTHCAHLTRNALIMKPEKVNKQDREGLKASQKDDQKNQEESKPKKKVRFFS